MNKKQRKGCSNTDMFNTSTLRENPRQQIRQVRWIPPDAGWIKINSAGIWKDSEAGAGGVIRSADGSLINGYMMKIAANSIIDAKLQALSIVLDIVKDQGRLAWIELGTKQANGSEGRLAWIELGTKQVVSLLSLKRFGAANLRHRVTDIRNKIRQMEAKFSHIPTQVNKVAVVLAQQGSKKENGSTFGQTSAPAIVTALIRMDQLGYPSFWVREHNYEQHG
ncbi:hypothetical protein SASPL_145621 [Salvia splendens]|uniref:RNase H type-1 domain-containing protein n=1 Tax=Salvia splendens TaxID=180675 RepID=A0A8X8WI31_SALSN|nr:hypothetical protein SASPL_145621 [Salvia splendens]